MHETTCVLVVAAGKGSRFGGAKQLAPIEGKPLLRHVIENLCGLNETKLLVVLGAYADQVKPTLVDLDADIIINALWKTGMASSLKTGVAHISENYPQVNLLVVVMGDQLLITADHLSTYLNAAKANEGSIIATNYNGHPGVPVAFPKAEWDLFDLLHGDEGARKLLIEKENVVLLDIPEAHEDMDFSQSKWKLK